MNSINNIISLGPYKQEISSGGGYGHLSNIHELDTLTFADLKEIVKRAFSGTLDVEGEVTEKIDGFNIMITWKNGQIMAARTNTQIRNKGEKALTKADIVKKFSGRGQIRDAFVFALYDLEKALKGLSEKDLFRLFGDGANFANMEIVYSKSLNTVPYEKSMLMFHGILKYSDAGKITGEVKDGARKIVALLEKVNKNVQKHFKIEVTQSIGKVDIPDAKALTNKNIKSLTTLQKKYGLSNSNTIRDYRIAWFTNYIDTNAKKMGTKLSSEARNGLIERWGNGNRMEFKKAWLSKVIEPGKFLQWVLKQDLLVNNPSKFKEHINPLHQIIIQVGVDMLKYIKPTLAIDHNKLTKKLRGDVAKAISQLQASGNSTKFEELMAKLNAAGGLDSIFPIEGVVFKYKGNVLKLTGTFPVFHGILGLLRTIE